MNNSLNLKPGTIQEVAYILQDSFIDADTIVAFAKFLAKDRKTTPELVKEFKSIKSSSSRISPEALRKILTLFGMGEKEVNESVRMCDFDTPQFLMDPFILSSEKNSWDNWSISQLTNEPRLSPAEVWQRNQKAINILSELISNMLAKSSEAAEACTGIAIRMVEVINKSKRTNPELFKNIARKRPQWPVLRSRHPFFCEPEDSLLADVGEGYDFVIDSVAKWDPKDPGTKVAMELYYFINELRGKVAAFLKMTANFDKKKVLASKPWIQQVANLQDFNRETALAWWNLAKLFLKDRYPDPIQVPTLAILGKRSLNQKGGPTRSSNKANPGTLRRDIFHNIKGKFMSLPGR